MLYIELEKGSSFIKALTPIGDLQKCFLLPSSLLADNIMVKFLTVAIVVSSSALILITTKLALAQQPSRNDQFPVISYSTTNLPVCYMQTQEGLIQDLSSLCGKTSKQPLLSELTRLTEQMCGSETDCAVDVMIIKQ